MSQLSTRPRRAAKAALSRIGPNRRNCAPIRMNRRRCPAARSAKMDILRLEFADRGDRSVMAFMDRRVPFPQRALYWDEAMPQMPCIFIITTTGCVITGRPDGVGDRGRQKRAGPCHHAVGDQGSYDECQLRLAAAGHCRGGRRLSGVHARSAHPAPYFALLSKTWISVAGNRSLLCRSRAAGAGNTTMKTKCSIRPLLFDH